MLWLDGKRHEMPTLQLDVVDRIGGGDGFAGGLFYGLLSRPGAGRSVAAGLAAGALLTTFPRHVATARLDEVVVLAKGGSARVQR